MKTCPQCHASNALDANHCVGCQAPLDRVPSSAYCERGHAIDPNWPECYQCKAEDRLRAEADKPDLRMPTVFEGGQIVSAGRATVLEGAEPRKPVISGLPSGAARRVTQFVPASAPLPAAPDAAAAPAAPGRKPVRRITGLLITYTWRPEGQTFPVREGRNLIGRNPEKCDIAVPEDPNLSEINSHITFRRSFTLGDMVSMSGTDLNGAPVEENFVRLPNYSQIRTGSTHWIFIMVDPAAAGEQETPKP